VLEDGGGSATSCEGNCEVLSVARCSNSVKFSLRRCTPTPTGRSSDAIRVTSTNTKARSLTYWRNSDVRGGGERRQREPRLRPL